MRNTRHGFTLIELLIMIAIAGIIGAILFGGVTSCMSSGDKANAEARRFASEMGLNVKGVTCADRDTDKDGYVSCTVSVDEEGKTRLEAIECAARYSWNDGCRMQKPVVYRNTNGPRW